MRVKYRVLDDHGFPKDGAYRSGRVLTISDGGMLLQMDRHAELGQKLEVCSIPGSSPTGIFGIVRVVHIVRSADILEVGVEFELRQKI